MSDFTSQPPQAEDVVPQPVTDRDTTVDPADPAQAEWELTGAVDAGASAENLEATTASGDDPAQIPSDDNEIPATDLPSDVEQPDTQGESPVIADLGEAGQGDLAPEDL